MHLPHHGHEHSHGVGFDHATPILRVSDFDAAIAYYVDVLGFTLEWSMGRFGSVRRGEAALMLCEGSQGCAHTWVWIGVSDADALHDELRSRGARIRNPPNNYPWGSRELHVTDVDGHVLRLGAESKPGEPLGVWLDDDGARWQAQPDGNWTRVP